jgi:hypothetical protein
LKPFQASLSSDHDFTSEEVKAMDKLIVSLSLEPTDEIRRNKVVSIFDKELSKPNGAPKRFTDLFDTVLMIVGDRVQVEAKKRAFEKGPQTTDAAEQDALQEDFMSRSPEERQLWALVDLMVQTKTIVKRSSGRLGNGGTFT